MNQPLRIAQVSDLHLSRSRAYYLDNWEMVLEWIDTEKPDRVIVTGDVVLSDPDIKDDLLFAREQLDRISAPWRVIPGNHDIGDNVVSGGMKQRVNEARRGRWLDVFGPDYWREDVNGWTLIGVNAQIFNSAGLAAEHEQAQWLDAAVRAIPADRPIALFVHKPLFTNRPSETDMTPDCLELEGRQRLLAPFAGRRLKLIASGHKHQYRSFSHDGVIHLWAPSTGVINFGPDKMMWGLRQVGFLDIELKGDRVRQRLVGSDFLFRHESYIRIGEYGSILEAPEHRAE